MEILLWLVPACVTTLVAMGWVAWWGRDGRGEVDREVQLARFARAMDREPAPRRIQVEPRPRERSTGIAVRRSRRDRAGAA